MMVRRETKTLTNDQIIFSKHGYYCQNSENANNVHSEIKKKIRKASLKEEQKKKSVMALFLIN